MSIEQIYQAFRDSSGVCTDTRHIKQDCIFFALKGENFNGNSFVGQAFENGAKYAVVDEDVETNHPGILRTEDGGALWAEVYTRLDSGIFLDEKGLENIPNAAETANRLRDMGL